MIPLASPFREFEMHKKGIEDAISRVLKSGNYILGDEVRLFELEFSSYCNESYGIGVANGTDALFLALRALGIGEGDEVITVPNTAIATAKAIENSGARPVFVDVGKNYLINPDLIEEKITSKTKALIPVHLYGNVCEMKKINDIGKKHNLSIIEDCAQAHGAKYFSKRVPIYGLGCFSFYPTKNLGAIGDGGMIVARDQDLSQKLIKLRQYGQESVRIYHSLGEGWNSRLDELQAGILREKLKYLEFSIEERARHAEFYSKNLKGVSSPIVSPNISPVWHLYVPRSENRDDLIKYLGNKDIRTGIHYPIPLHLQEGFRYLGYGKGDFPMAEKLSREIISLPIFPGLREEERDKVMEAINEFSK